MVGPDRCLIQIINHLPGNLVLGAPRGGGDFIGLEKFPTVIDDQVGGGHAQSMGIPKVIGAEIIITGQVLGQGIPIGLIHHFQPKILLALVVAELIPRLHVRRVTGGGGPRGAGESLALLPDQLQQHPSGQYSPQGKRPT